MLTKSKTRRINININSLSEKVTFTTVTLTND